MPNTSPGVGIPIYFAEPWRDNDADKVAPGWRSDLVNGMNQMSIEIDLGAAATPTLAAQCIFDFPASLPQPQMIKRVERALLSPAGNSFDWVLPFRKGFLQQISVYPDGGNTTTPASKITLRAGGVPIHEATRAAQLACDQLAGSYPAATGRNAYVSDIVLDGDGLMERAIDLSQAGEVTCTIESTATMSGNMVVIAQLLDLP